MADYLTLLDVDGAMVDSCRECYLRTVEAWPDIRNDEPVSEQDFRAFRPLVLKAEDFYTLSALKKRGGNVPRDYSFRRDEYVSWFGDEPAEFRKLFYFKRKLRKETDRAGWIEENSLYEGVPEMLEGLRDIEGMDVMIVTSKDRDSPRDILDHYGLFDGFISDVISRDDVEENATRREQFRLAMDRTGVRQKNVTVYDDMSENLAVANEFDFFPIAAEQGYDFKMNLMGYIKAIPAEVPETVRENFRIS